MIRAAVFLALIAIMSCVMYSSADSHSTPPPPPAFPPDPPEGCEIITCKTGCRFIREAARAGNSTEAFCTGFATQLQIALVGSSEVEYEVVRQYRADKCRVSCGPFDIGESVLRCENDDNEYGRRYVLRSGIPCVRSDYGKGQYTCRTFGRTEEDCNPMPDMPPPMMVALLVPVSGSLCAVAAAFHVGRRKRAGN